jgi:hypothetical protein
MKHLKLFIFAVLLNILPMYSIAQDYDFNQQQQQQVRMDEIMNNVKLHIDSDYKLESYLRDYKLELESKAMQQRLYEASQNSRISSSIYTIPAIPDTKLPSNPGFNKNKQRSLDDIEQQETGKSAEEVSLKDSADKIVQEWSKNAPKESFMGYYDANLDMRYNDPENRAFGVYSSPVAPTSNHGSLGIVLGSILFIGCIGAFFWFNGKTE